MNDIKIILMVVFFFSAISFFYDSGKYSEGWSQTRSGSKWQFYALCNGIADLIIMFMVWFA